MSRTRNALLGLMVLAGVLALPVATSGADRCQQAAGVYREPQAAPLDPDEYEVGIEMSTYGTGPGLPVPWAAVDAWVADHPAQRLLACGTEQGYTLVELQVRGGYAYVMLTPSDTVNKIYLSTTQLPWD